MDKRIIKSNIKKTLFFSYSIIFSTLFFVTYLALKNEYWDIQDEIKILNQSKNKYSNNIKSLKRKRSLLIQAVESIASKDYNFNVPDPQPFVVIMDKDE